MPSPQRGYHDFVRDYVLLMIFIGLRASFVVVALALWV